MEKRVSRYTTTISHTNSWQIPLAKTYQEKMLLRYLLSQLGDILLFKLHESNIPWAVGGVFFSERLTMRFMLIVFQCTNMSLCPQISTNLPTSF